MSTLKTTSITHGSNSGTANLALGSDGTITFAKKPALGRQVLEQFYTLCDGTAITTDKGTVTTTDVTAVQAVTSTYADITGSSLSYTPPTGTTQVIYEFQFQLGSVDAAGIGHFNFYIDSDEVTQARFGTAGTGSSYPEGLVHFKWGINIGGSADTTAGRLATWSSGKTLKMQVREWGSNDEIKLHETRVWDGGGSSQYRTPCVGITAIGAA